MRGSKLAALTRKFFSPHSGSGVCGRLPFCVQRKGADGLPGDQAGGRRCRRPGYRFQPGRIPPGQQLGKIRGALYPGGFIQSTQISTPENIDEYQRGLTLYSLLLSSGLLFLMFYFLLSAAIQKNREYLAPALCCLVIALRNQFFFAEHLLSADYDFYLEYRLVVLDVSLIPASALYLLSAFYRKALRPRSLAVFAAAVAVLTALHPPLVPAGASAGAAVFAPTGSADGVTVGVDETHYGPELDCTRGQIMTFLWRAGGSPEPEST